MNNSAILTLTDVAAGYRKKVIIRSVNMDIKKGEIVSILGANGSGKSTLFRAIMRTLRHVEGEVLFNGVSLTKLSTHQIAQLGIGYLLQSEAVFTGLTVKENLDFAGMGGEANALYAEEIFEFFPSLRKQYKRRSGFLSGGERQMLAIAMVLAKKPQLALLDEPSAGLSPVMVNEVMAIIRDFHAKYATTFLIIEQNIRSVLDIAHSVYILKNGELRLNQDIKNAILEDKLQDVFFS